MLNISSDSAVLVSTLLAGRNISFHMPCGGRGTCLKCKIRITGDVLPPSEQELSLLTEAEREADIRLACMAYVNGTANVEFLSSESQSDVILVDGELEAVPLRPWTEGEYGIAIDIGTTTIAAYLYSLQNGKEIDVWSALNPQVVFGGDVVSRVEKAVNGEGQQLADAVCSCIDRMILTVCQKHGIAVDAVGGIVIAGNTAMLYLLTGRNPVSIASAPFLPDQYFGEFLLPEALRLCASNAKIYLTRSIAAYVGGDITAALLVSGIYKGGTKEPYLSKGGTKEPYLSKGGTKEPYLSKGDMEKPRLLLDIGTNGEMVLSVKGQLYCCSAAAGPAFEGAGLSCGMTAQTGAIHKVTPYNGTVRVSVIGGGKAEGICGSGLIDAIAAMLELELLEPSGVLADDEEAFYFPGTSVAVSQRDIREIQLAKAAICAALLAMLHKAGIGPEDVAEVCLAGGFGNHINVQSAERIGLIPKGFADKTRYIGNAAGMGASMILLNEDLLHKSEELSREIQPVSLSTDPYFMEQYIECMMF